jgi:diacylglycerol kinase (ATP)
MAGCTPNMPAPAQRPAAPDRVRHTLPQSFGYAWNGLVETALRGRNFRIQLGLGVLVCAFAAVAPLAAGERALLLLCAALVLAAEALNSALEAAVDLASPGPSEGARIAKDAAAGAVLALSAGSVLVFAVLAGEIAPALAALAPRLVLPATGALGAALAAGLLPAPWPRPVAIDAALAIGGAAGVVPVAVAASSQAGTAGAALLLAVAFAAVVRRGRA